MLHSKNVPRRLWAEGLKKTAFLINRLPQQRLCFIFPFEKLWNMEPSISYLRVFGCVYYVFVPNYLRSKMEKKVVRGIFIGYDSQRKGWRCCDPTIRKCYTSQNLVFDEASSWWSPNKEVLPDSDVFKDMVQYSQIHLSLDEAKDVDNEGNVEEGVAESPWQTGMYNNQAMRMSLVNQKLELH